jgi:hypothetical protein
MSILVPTLPFIRGSLARRYCGLGARGRRNSGLQRRDRQGWARARLEQDGYQMDKTRIVPCQDTPHASDHAKVSVRIRTARPGRCSSARHCVPARRRRDRDRLDALRLVSPARLRSPMRSTARQNARRIARVWRIRRPADAAIGESGPGRCLEQVFRRVDYAGSQHPHQGEWEDSSRIVCRVCQKRRMCVNLKADGLDGTVLL